MSVGDNDHMRVSYEEKKDVLNLYQMAKRYKCHAQPLTNY